MNISTETEDYVNSLEPEAQVVDLLDDLRSHHEESYFHSIRVGKLAVELGSRYSTAENEDKAVLGYGGLLHDIGKTKVPDQILNKPGKLAEEERKVIDSHVEKGYEILREEGLNNIAEVARFHHDFKREKPRRNQMINPELVEIISAADVYDACTKERSYKDSMPKEQVREIMTEEHNFKIELNWV